MIKKLLLAATFLTTLSASAQTNQFDLSITQTHKNIYCGESILPHSVWVKNVGTDSILSVELFYRTEVDSIYQSYIHSDTLYPTDSVLITLGSIELADGMNTIIDSIGMINDTIVDENMANNFATVNVHVYNPVLELPQSINFDSGIAYNWLVLDNEKQFTSGVGNWYLGNLSGDYYGPDSSREVLMINNFTIESGTKSYFYSPYVTLNSGTKTVEFYHSYARRANAIYDKLELVYSLDCGQTWTLLWSRVGDQLNTTNPVSSVFIPKYDQWTFNQVNITNLLGDAIFAFVATSGEGNFLYLDNIVIREGGFNSTNELFNAAEINIYPNPATENIFVDIQSDKVQTVNVNISNVLGQTVQTQTNIKLQEGKNTLSLSTNTLPAGIYLLEINNNTNKISKKFIVQ